MYDPKQIDPLRIRHEAGMAEIVAVLDSSVAQFRTELGKRRNMRQQLSESLEKITEHRRTIIISLKELVRQNDRNKKDFRNASAELSHLQKDEVVILESHKNILSGRHLAPELSPAKREPGDDDTVNSPGDLKVRSARFLTSIQDALTSLELELETLKNREETLVNDMKELTDRIKKGERRRDILFTKLSLYKEEARTAQRKLDDSAQREQAILNEYIYYSQRLKEAVPITPNAVSVLAQKR